jgi:hypothetical protein
MDAGKGHTMQEALCGLPFVNRVLSVHEVYSMCSIRCNSWTDSINQETTRAQTAHCSTKGS